jgi:hypothetical protein
MKDHSGYAQEKFPAVMFGSRIHLQSRPATLWPMAMLCPMCNKVRIVLAGRQADLGTATSSTHCACPGGPCDPNRKEGRYG